MTELLADKVWISIVLHFVFYVTDYYLGQYEGYMYHNYADAYMVFHGRYDGYDKQTEPENRRWFPNASFLIVLVVVSLGLYIGWLALVKQFGRSEIFLFLVGGLILFRVTRSLMRFRMISVFRFSQHPGEMEGKVEYSQRTTHTLLFMELYGYTVLYFLLFLIQGGWFLLGGVFTCFIAARRHRDWVMVKT